MSRADQSDLNAISGVGLHLLQLRQETSPRAAVEMSPCRGRSCPGDGVRQGDCGGTPHLCTGISGRGQVLEAQRKNTFSRKRGTSAKPRVPAKLEFNDIVLKIL